jgi:hypothetical protein
MAREYEGSDQSTGIFVGGALDYINSVDMTKFDDQLAMDYLRAFILDRTVGERMQTAVDNIRSGSAIDFPKIVAELNSELNIVTAIRQDTNYDALPMIKAYENIPRSANAIGIELYDSLMDGGFERPGANVLLGPTGVGKTLMGLDMSVSYAMQQYNLYLAGKEGRIVIFITREDGKKKIRDRVMCNIAQIPKDRLAEIRTYSDFSTSSNLRPYEIERYRATTNPELRLGEQERLEQATVTLQFLKVVDFSNLNTSQGGAGGVPEVAAVAESIRKKTGKPLGLLIDDWAGAAVERCTNYYQAVTQHRSELLSSWVKQQLDLVAGPLNIGVFVVHQLRGQVGKNPPTKIPTHADAEWCTTFANHAQYALVLGTKDQDSNACYLAATKTRDGEGKKAVLCWIDGQYGHLVRAGDKYRVDPQTNRIIRRKDANGLVNERLSSTTDTIDQEVEEAEDDDDNRNPEIRDAEMLFAN